MSGFLLLALLVVAPASPDPGCRSAAACADSAYAALEAGDWRSARDFAEEGRALAPEDPRPLIALGRAHLARPELGRFRALELFREAARLLPDDPGPRYWIGRTGVALLGSDGEGIARRGLEEALALDPRYRDAWELWSSLYRGPDERARMAEILGPHADDPVVAARLARLLVEGGRCAAADTLLRRLSDGAPRDPRYPAWRAECAFLRERDRQGHRLYARAVELAAADTADALWAQVVPLARPPERAAYAALDPRDRPAFYRSFWTPRDPDVRTPENERIPEHFRRMREARRRFRLLHPLSRYHYLPAWRNYVTRVPREAAEAQRSFFGEEGIRLAGAIVRSAAAGEAAGDPVPPGSVDEAVAREEAGAVEDLVDALLEGPDGEAPGAADGGFDPRRAREAGTSPELLPVGRNLPAMVDDRGIAFIRHGEPDRIAHPSESLDESVWRYRGDPPLVLRFSKEHRPPAPPVSDMIHRPATREQARSVGLSLVTERSSLPAPLEFAFWFARFRDRDAPDSTGLALFPEPGIEATAVLWDGAGREVSRDDASGGEPIRLTGAPGRLALALDGARNDSLGRHRAVVELPDFSAGGVGVSDVILSRDPGPGPPTREEALAAALPVLETPAGEAFTVYVEVYGLPVREGLHRYEVEYVFEEDRSWIAELFGRHRTTLRFRRETPADGDGIAVETVRVDAGRLEPGRYDLTVRVRVPGEEDPGTGRTVSLRLAG